MNQQQRTSQTPTQQRTSQAPISSPCATN